MKRSVLFILLSLTCFTSCLVHDGDLLKNTDGVLTFKASSATRSTLANHSEVWWEPGDEIKIFFGQESGRFSSSIEEPVGVADFSGFIPGGIEDGSEVWALYPWSAEASFDGSAVKTIVPSTQTARAGSFSSGQNISLAKTVSRTLMFYNVLGGVRFRVNGANIKSVRLRGNNGEFLAGKVAVCFDQNGLPAISTVSDPQTEIILSLNDGRALDPQVWYYIAAIPQVLSKGATLITEFLDGTTQSTVLDQSLEIKRGVFGSVRGLGSEMTAAETAEAVDEGLQLLDSDNDQDLYDAFDLFTDAAQGVGASSDSAKLYLAYCYEYGLGTEPNLEKAKELYVEVASEGNQEAQVKMDQLVGGQTNAEIIIPGATPRDMEQVVLICDGTIKTPNGDGSFQTSEDRIIASTADEKLLYLSFRNPGRNKSNEDLVLDAKETALSFLMWGIPFADREMTDEEYAGMRSMLLSFQETSSLIASIESSVKELGYIDLDRISPEAMSASERVASIFGIGIEPRYSSVSPFVTKKNVSSPSVLVSSPIAKSIAPSGESDGKPSFSVGSPFYYQGIKIIVDDIIPIPDTDKWTCKFTVYNYEPIYLSLMAGKKDGNDLVPIGESFLDHVVNPQNSNYIFQMGGLDGPTKTVEAQVSFWGDTILWLKGDKDFEDGSWNATETKFQMEIDSEQDVLLIYSARGEDCPQLWAYALFKQVVLPIMKMAIKVEGHDFEDELLKAFIKVGTDTKFIQKVQKLAGEPDLGPYLELIWDTCGDILFDSLDKLTEELIEKAIEPRYKKVIGKWANYDKVNNKLATKEQFKADLGELKLIKNILKAERIFINVAAWTLRQDIFTNTYFTFKFDEIPMGVITGEPYEDPYNVSVKIPVTVTGGSPIIKRGIIWSLTNENPTLDGEDCTVVYSSSHDKQFVAWVDGMPGGRKAYYRAFITYLKDYEETPPLYGNVVEYIPNWSMLQANNEIWYLSTDGQIVEPADVDAFGNNKIVSNSIKDGQGIIVFENPVTVVGERAFEDCSNLKVIQLPKSVTDIGKYAFRFCTSLSRAEIRGTLTSCGELAFACQNLEYFVGPNAFGSKSDYLVIGDKIVAFAPKDQTEVDIPSGITSIGPMAFGGCTEVTSIAVPEGVTHLDAAAFVNCIRLSSVMLPQSLTTVGDELFSGCFELEKVTFLSDVTSIGINIFDRCYALREAHFHSMTPPVRSGAFATGLSPDFRIYVPNASLEAYKTADKWSDDADIILPESAQPDNPSNPDLPTPKGNELYYTSTDGSIIVPDTGYNSFGANIVSNTYENGVGCIVFDKDINVIPPLAYYQKETLVSICIPEGVQLIERDAFYGCSSLIGIETPKSLTEIRNSAFENCTSLSFFISNSTLLIGNWAFDGCTSLKTLEFRRRMVSIGGFEDHPTLASVSFTEGVSSIDRFAFSNCPSLTNVNIGSGVTSIGEYAFDKCSSLKSIIIDGETEIGFRAFCDCKDLSMVILKGGVKTIGASAFFNCHSLSSIEVPSSVISIGESAFSGCSSLSSARIRARITSIENSLFKDCSSMESIAFPNDIKTIGSSVFSGCSKLRSITLPNSLTSIGEMAFYNCSALKTVIIPTGVTSIVDNLFHGCTSLESVSLPSGLKSIGWSAFSDCAALCDLTIPSSVSFIDAIAFSNCSSLTSITIPSGITVIRGSSFYKCSSLVSVSIPSSVIKIEDEAFMGCSSLRDISIPSSVTAVGSKVFKDCSSLKKITLPEGITTIPEYSFDNCSSLENFIIPKSVSSIGERAFHGCSSMRSVNLPNALTSLPKYAFQGCSSLESIDFPKSISVIDQFCFSNCSSLSRVVLPEGISVIEREVFAGCKSLTYVELPSSIVAINVNSFMDCSSLSTVILKSINPPSLPQFPYNAFWTRDIHDCLFYVPAGSVNTYKTTDRWNQYADKIRPLYDDVGGTEDITPGGDINM